MPPFDFENASKKAFDSIKNTLGIELTYFPKVGAPVDIRGVFDDRSIDSDPDTEVRVSSNLYTLGIKFDDLNFLPAKGDKALIKGIFYLVIDSQEDGVSGASTFLVLQREKAA